MNTQIKKKQDFINQLSNMILLNMLFLVSCIPVFTTGTAIMALTSVLRVATTDKDAPIIVDYFICFRKYWRVGMIYTLVLLITGGLLINNFIFTTGLIGVRYNLFLGINVFMAICGISSCHNIPYILVDGEDSFIVATKKAIIISIRYLTMSLLNCGQFVLFCIFFAGGCLLFKSWILPFVIIGFSGYCFLANRRMACIKSDK
ncbi:YesL family protein [Enterococcus casseliflavus]|uniref:YesL family protein n=1 Tax=Enterococcus casseliflavus TaxID=37734 RepID=UPI001432982B|nr:YesL family protein [Enterococcus casseliflavus]NKD28201.1 YesL family protein [Enterococcus casseliflavus]